MRRCARAVPGGPSAARARPAMTAGSPGQRSSKSSCVSQYVMSFNDITIAKKRRPGDHAWPLLPPQRPCPPPKGSSPRQQRSKDGQLLVGTTNKRPGRRLFAGVLAERVGFEPTVGLHLRLISSQVHSTTLPPLRRRVL